MVDVGGNAIAQESPDRRKLIKGFQAHFWFAWGCAIVAVLTALTLKIGHRGKPNETFEEEFDFINEAEGIQCLQFECMDLDK
jgi:hypothetical protein